MRIKTRLAWLAVIPLCALAVLIALPWLVLAAMADPAGKRAWELGEAFDRLANAAVGGQSEMTLSAHAGDRLHRAEMADRIVPRWAYWLCRLLDAIDPDHCEKSRPKGGS